MGKGKRNRINKKQKRALEAEFDGDPMDFKVPTEAPFFTWYCAIQATLGDWAIMVYAGPEAALAVIFGVLKSAPDKLHLGVGPLPMDLIGDEQFDRVMHGLLGTILTRDPKLGWAGNEIIRKMSKPIRTRSFNGLKTDLKWLEEEKYRVLLPFDELAFQKIMEAYERASFDNEVARMPVMKPKMDGKAKSEDCIACGQDHDVEPEIGFTLLVRTLREAKAHLHVFCDAVSAMRRIPGVSDSIHIGYMGICAGQTNDPNAHKNQKRGMEFLEAFIGSKEDVDPVALLGLTPEQGSDLLARATTRVIKWRAVTMPSQQ